MTPREDQQAAGGWYPDPKGDGVQRYWDGSAWTDQRRRPHDSKTGGRKRFDVSQIGVGVAIVGAAMAILACFLPAAEVPVQFSEVKSNSLIQDQGDAAWLLVGSLAVIGTAFRAYRSGRKSWVPAVIGGLIVVASIVFGSTDSEALTLYHLNASGEAITSLPAVHADPGIGIYVLGLGGIMMVTGGIWILSSALVSEGDGPRQAAGSELKRCPDCAEAVLVDARVCKHCGYRFDSAKSDGG